jgi:hypothetical protein
MDDLLREAIADAKAVRETALENAKIALEEAFTPRLQSMLSKKIAAEAEMEDEEEGAYEEEEMESEEEMEMDSDDVMDSDEMSHDAEEEMDAEEMRDSEEGEEMREEEAEEEDSIEEEEAEEEDSVEEAEDAEEEDELDLESVLRELEADLDDEDDIEEAEDKEEEDTVDENDVSSDIGDADNKVNPEANDSSKTGAQGPEGEGSDEAAGNELDDHDVVDDLTEVEDKEEEDLDLDEVLKALTEEEDAEEEADKVEELQAELKETREVVQFMRDKLNEVNLLNAKLLFSNKLFRAFGLNNDQKLKVVETFDRTKNLREVKLVYATLAESFRKPSNRISESVKKGSSSKPVASTKPAKQEVLSEGQELKARFKKLANIL